MRYSTLFSLLLASASFFDGTVAECWRFDVTKTRTVLQTYVTISSSCRNPRPLTTTSKCPTVMTTLTWTSTKTSCDIKQGCFFERIPKTTSYLTTKCPATTPTRDATPPLKSDTPTGKPTTPLTTIKMICPPSTTVTATRSCIIKPVCSEPPETGTVERLLNCACIGASRQVTTTVYLPKRCPGDCSPTTITAFTPPSDGCQTKPPIAEKTSTAETDDEGYY